jgi:hypothetical protein
MVHEHRQPKQIHQHDVVYDLPKGKEDEDRQYADGNAV